MSAKEDRTVGGFVFGTQQEADLARKDEEKITFLESRMDYTKLETVRVIYQKAIENRIFETPVGYSYLLGIYNMLKGQGMEDLEAVVLNAPLPRAREEQKPLKKIEPSKVREVKVKLYASLTLNLILAGIVTAMFVIALKGSNPNILNYENALVNKYAAWEQELTERENAIREKERSLMIEP